MSKTKKFVAALALMFLLALGLVPATPAHAEDTSADKPLYLALGDSITYGYEPDPDDPTKQEGKQLTDECFVNILAAEKGYRVENYGVIGNTATGIMGQLETGELDSSIKEAKIVTITCGGNDLMQVVYQKAADLFNSSESNVKKYGKLTADDVVYIIWRNDKSTTDASTELLLVQMCAASAILSPVDGEYIEDQEAFTSAVTEFTQNINKVTAYIKGLNPNVRIFVTTQYNPYEHFSGSYENIGIRIGACADKFAQVVKDNAEAGGYTVADVHAAFTGQTATLCNATEDPLTLDFHPSVAGHAVIAQVFSEIVKPTVEITAEAKTKVYGEEDPELTATTKYAENVEGFSYSLSREEGEDVGEYDITLDENDAYFADYTAAKLTITPKSIVPDTDETPDDEKTGVSAEPLADVTENGQAQEQVPTITDSKTGKTLTAGTDFTPSYEGDTTNPGTVTVTVTGKGNYQGTFELTYNILKDTTPKGDGDEGEKGDEGEGTDDKEKADKQDDSSLPQTGDTDSSMMIVVASAGIAAIAAAVLRRTH